MSLYTNDIDTLRQFLSQSIPQALSSARSIVFMFAALFYTNVLLTFLVNVLIGLMLMITKFITSKSSKYFTEQQRNIGQLNGFLEEMMNGQKVIKVFSHENKTKDQFDSQNTMLNNSMYKANKYANSLLPVITNLSNLMYILVTVIGGLLAIYGKSSITLGGIVTFLMLTKLLSQPIGQISQQLNSIILGLAGAERIFKTMDEMPEENKGTITLVKVREENGILVETTSEKKQMGLEKNGPINGRKYLFVGKRRCGFQGCGF